MAALKAIGKWLEGSQAEIITLLRCIQIFTGNSKMATSKRIFSAIPIDQAHERAWARVIGEFENSCVQGSRNVMEDFGNPFEEESQDLLVLDTKEIAHSDVVKTVHSAKSIGQDQFDIFTKECLADRTTPVDDTIHCNKLSLFSTPVSKASKKKKQIDLLKCDVELFSRFRHMMATLTNFLKMKIKHVLLHFLL